MKQDLVISVRRPPGGAHVYRMGIDEIRVGRGRACHVRLPDPAVSGLHLVFRRTVDGFEMLDPGSKNGVRVGRTRLAPGAVRLVEHADLITLGPFTLEVFLESAMENTTDHRETGRLAHALAMEEARRVRAPWIVSVTEGDHSGEVLIPTAENPIHLNASGSAFEHEDGNDGVAVTLAIGPKGELMARRFDNGTSVVSILHPGDRLTVGGAVLEIDAGAPAVAAAAPPRWTPFEAAVVAGVLLAITATVAAWFAA